MALFTRFIHEKNVVALTAYGRLKGKEVEQCVKEYANHPFFNPETDVLIDLEEDLRVGLDFIDGLSQANRLVRATRKRGEKYFIAGVARRPELRGVMEAIGKEIDGNFEIATFDELASAVHWLNLKRGGSGPRS